MRKAFLLILATLPALAGTRILDTWAGNPSGYLVIEWPAFQTAAGKAVAGGKRIYTVRGGVVDLELEPTEGTSARYSVRTLFGVVSATEQWGVPVASPVTLQQVRDLGAQGGGATQTIVRFADNVVPLGVIDGANAVFTLPNAPAPAASLLVFRNGLLQKAGLDYALVGVTITFQAGAIPQSGDLLLASYRW